MTRLCVKIEQQYHNCSTGGTARDQEDFLHAVPFLLGIQGNSEADLVTD
jgi:hypothetical protein